MSDPHNTGTPPPPLDTDTLRAVHEFLGKLMEHASDKLKLHVVTWEGYLAKALDETLDTADRQGAIFCAAKAAAIAVQVVTRRDLDAAGIHRDEIDNACIITRAACRVKPAGAAIESTGVVLSFEGPLLRVAET